MCIHVIISNINCNTICVVHCTVHSIEDQYCTSMISDDQAPANDSSKFYKIILYFYMTNQW